MIFSFENIDDLFFKPQKQTFWSVAGLGEGCQETAEQQHNSKECDILSKEVAHVKKKNKVDILTQTEKITGIPIQEIIQSACKGKFKTLNEADEIVYYYEQTGVIIKPVKDFALFLLREWLNEHDKKK